MYKHLQGKCAELKLFVLMVLGVAVVVVGPTADRSQHDLQMIPLPPLVIRATFGNETMKPKNFSSKHSNQEFKCLNLC